MFSEFLVRIDIGDFRLDEYNETSNKYMKFKR